MSRRLWLSMATVLTACAGDISNGSSEGSSANGSTPPGSFGGGPGNSRDPWNAGAPPVTTGGGESGEPELPAPITRFARLTHTQWKNSVLDLLRLELKDAGDITSRLRADSRSGGFLFDNYGGTLTVDDAMVNAYQQVAEELAEQVAADPSALARLTRASAGPAFIEEFTLRAHRHPLTDAQREDYERLFAAGSELYGDMEPFAAGVRVVIEAALQSPFFLYRTELSGQENNGVIPLDAYEVASRMSYALWNSMPDDALFEAASNGQLTESAGRSEQVERMLADARATDTLLFLHDQLLDAAKFDNIRPSSQFFRVSEALPSYAYEEHERFIREILLAEQGGVRVLLTSRETFANQELADIYGVAGGMGASYQRVRLDPVQRSGVFTHVGFLAANSTSADPDPIHRGKFLAERVACVSIAAPPVNIPAPPQVSDKTNRELIEEFTEAPGSECAACHKTLINPFGFPLENLDAIGGFRMEDRGKPVRTDASPMLDRQPRSVTDGVDMMEQMAESEGVHTCYAKHLLEFVFGRPSSREDKPLVDRLGRGSLDRDLSVQALLTELVSSDAFLTRSVEELP